MSVSTEPFVPSGDVKEADDDGRIPFSLRIAVTGHITLKDKPAVAQAIRRALQDIQMLCERPFRTFAWSRLPVSPLVTPVRYTIVSALAEGADRLVVHEAIAVLGEDIRLEAVLPREAEDYKRDFGTTASKAEFEAFLQRADTQVTMPKTMDDTEGYVLAGRYLVDRCDLLLAVWDGDQKRLRGGTRSVMDKAVKSGKPVYVVPASPAVRSPATAPSLGDAEEALRWIELYNRDPSSLGTLPRRGTLAEARRRLDTDLTAAGLDDPAVRCIAAWSLPRFARAEMRALRFQRVHYMLGDLLHLLAALAVTAVATQVVYYPHHTKAAAVEIGLLLLVICLVFVSRLGHFRDRWTDHRSLAEAFRSALFLAVGGVTNASDRDGAGDLRDVPEDWYQRAFTEAWADRPRDAPTASENEIRQFLVRSWIDDQIEYHEQTARRNLRRHDQIAHLIPALAALALVVAVLHFLNVGEGTAFPRVFLLLAIVLPGFGAAASGIREHRQFQLHGRRSKRTAERLQRIRRRVDDGLLDLPPQKLAFDTQSIITEESVEWSGVQELQELEVVM